MRIKVVRANPEDWEIPLDEFVKWVEETYPVKVRIFREDEMPTLECYKEQD